MTLAKKSLERNCEICMTDFVATHWRRTFCYKPHEVKCRVCSLTFMLDSIEGHIVRKIKQGIWTCSMKCVRSAQSNTKYCSTCKIETKHNWDTCFVCSFANRQSQMFCNLCNTETSHSGQSCMNCIGKNLSNKAFCDVCDEVTTHRKTTCMACVNKRPEVQQKIFANSSQYKLNHLDEYLTLNIEEWSARFKTTHGVLPTRVDFQRYFNFKNPPKLTAETAKFFNYQLKDSYWELLFQSLLLKDGLLPDQDFVRNTRFMIDDTGKRFELDFFFPEYLVAVEIQDLRTHSEDSDNEQSIFGSMMKGPLYHAAKKKLAASYGIELYEIWQGDLQDEVQALTNFQDVLLERTSPANFDDLALANTLKREYEEVYYPKLPTKFKNLANKMWWNK